MSNAMGLGRMMLASPLPMPGAADRLFIMLFRMPSM
jgi:hypothetical protein